jgi:hypothetical protein
MKDNVIIVAKTKMKSSSCVGGLLANGRFVRLLNEDGYNQDEDCQYELGQVYEIDYVDRVPRTKPHVEDICLSSATYLRRAEPSVFISMLKELGKAHFWEGSTDVVFDKKIKWTKSGSGYIDEDDIPESSVGFWITDKPLTRKDFGGHVRYSYPPIIRTTPLGIILGGRGWRNITYVGFQEPVDVIPAGTLCRVSLARWWRPDDADEEIGERCYLQLSGWYQPDKMPF